MSGDCGQILQSISTFETSATGIVILGGEVFSPESGIPAMEDHLRFLSSPDYVQGGTSAYMCENIAIKCM